MKIGIWSLFANKIIPLTSPSHLIVKKILNSACNDRGSLVEITYVDSSIHTKSLDLENFLI